MQIVVQKAFLSSESSTSIVLFYFLWLLAFFDFSSCQQQTFNDMHFFFNRNTTLRLLAI
eukprot:m.96221 g.96221  ORF g.96221 m.96221 type:complete len:59 (+) comp14785_c1_seq1:1463-1639(+)